MRGRWIVALKRAGAVIGLVTLGVAIIFLVTQLTDNFLIVGLTALGLLVTMISALDAILEEPASSLEERIRALTDSLNKAASTISEIEREVADRRGLVEQLSKDAETYRAISELHANEVEAVAQALRRVLQRRSRRDLTITAATNSLFFLMGVGVTILAQR